MSTRASLDTFRLSRMGIAERLARDIPDGYWVNLGIGAPTLVADIQHPGREIVFQCENGLIGMGPRPADPSERDDDIINAAKEPVTVVEGGSFVDHSESFAMIRGGHLDLAVLGAYEVSGTGDLANWRTKSDSVPAVGGAMDLAAGARAVWVMMSLCTASGDPKLVERCSYPLTAAAVVDRVFTDFAVFSIQDGRVVVDDIVPGLSFDQLQSLTPVKLER